MRTEHSSTAAARHCCALVIGALGRVPPRAALLALSVAACTGMIESDFSESNDALDARVAAGQDAADARASNPADAALEPVPGLAAVFFKRYFEPRGQAVVPGVSFDWGSDGPGSGVLPNYFALRLSGELHAGEGGSYGFRADVDDGLRVWVDDAIVIDQWRDGSHQSAWTEVDLASGWVPLRIEYYELTGPAALQLYWRPPGGVEEPIPTAALRAVDSAMFESPKPPYINPVTQYDCPDPGALKVGDWIYAACTGGRMRLRRSRDLVIWEETEVYIMPADGKPPWSLNGSRNWAPELHLVGDRYIAYFTANDAQGRLSIGAAVASNIDGPFVHQAGPMVTHERGVIDATYFRDDDGRHYLIYKIDGNAYGLPTPNYIRELRPDGLGFAAGSSQHEILRNDASSWEGPVAEAPWLHKRNDRYYLFYSGNGYNYNYRTGVARADSVTGPYQKHGAPILANNSKWVGPGHGSIVKMGGMDYWLYHAWPTTDSGAQDSSRGRLMMVDRIDWADGWPHIEDDGTPSMSHRVRPGVAP